MERGQLERLMMARSNKTFSVQEKIMEKAKMEAIGISEIEVENLHDLFVCRVEMIFSGQHNSQRLSGPVRKHEGAAGDLAVKINIGFFNDRNIAEFRHDRPFCDDRIWS